MTYTFKKHISSYNPIILRKKTMGHEPGWQAVKKNRGSQAWRLPIYHISPKEFLSGKWLPLAHEVQSANHWDVEAFLGFFLTEKHGRGTMSTMWFVLFVNIWVFPKNSGCSSQIIHFNRVFHYKPSILGYPYFWKHPFATMIFESLGVLKPKE